MLVNTFCFDTHLTQHVVLLVNTKVNGKCYSKYKSNTVKQRDKKVQKIMN